MLTVWLCTVNLAFAGVELYINALLQLTFGFYVKPWIDDLCARAHTHARGRPRAAASSMIDGTTYVKKKVTVWDNAAVSRSLAVFHAFVLHVLVHLYSAACIENVMVPLSPLWTIKPSAQIGLVTKAGVRVYTGYCEKCKHLSRPSLLCRALPLSDQRPIISVII